MKTKGIFFIALLLIWAGSIHAQANYGEFRWGLKAGADFADTHNDGDFEEGDGKAGFVGGAFCKIPLKHYLSIRPELLFAMKGGKLRIPSDVAGQTDEANFAVNYIEMPLSVDLDLPYFLDFHA